MAETNCNNCYENSIYFFFGGFLIAIEYFITGVFFCSTIYYISTGIGLINLSYYMAFPLQKGWGQLATMPVNSPLGSCGWAIRTILWFPFLILIGTTHLIFMIILALPIIGIPYAHLHLKLMTFVLYPLFIDDYSMQNRAIFY